MADRAAGAPAGGQGRGDVERGAAAGAVRQPRPSASPWPSSRSGSSTARRATRGGTRSTSAADSTRATGQLHRRLVRPLPAGAGRRLRGAPARRRSARLTIGQWTHGSPGLFTEAVRDGPRWFDSQLDGDEAGRDERAGRTGPPVRHGVAHVAGVLHVATGGEDRELVPRAGRHPRAGPRHRPTTSRPTATTTTPATHALGGRPLAEHDHGGAQGTVAPGAPPRRAHVHQPCPDRRPDGDRPGDRDVVRALVARAHRLLRAAVRRDGEGEVVQPERRHRPPHPWLRRHDDEASPSCRSPCGRPPTPSGPVTASACRSRAAPTRCSTATRGRASPGDRCQPALGRPGDLP